MIDIPQLQNLLRQQGMETWAQQLEGQLQRVLLDKPHGDMDRWQQVLDQLPLLRPLQVDLTQAAPVVGSANELDDRGRQNLQGLLQQLHPWRKGPYSLFGVHVDTEWRSDWKWQRLAPHISPLKNRKVLDVGCGNGYHCWRMAGEGADLVLGIDPTALYLSQFLAIRHFLGDTYPVHLLPLGLEQLPRHLQAFDTVFSMGILYHRMSPLDHLVHLRETLRPGGELVLETLVVEGDVHQVLVPGGRYAKMRNVWFIPSPAALVNWLQRCGYKDVRVVDVTPTTTKEQRATEWMYFESLADYLDPQDSAKTIEGYPAPVRALLIARA